jgi:hypothetical protein
VTHLAERVDVIVEAGYRGASVGSWEWDTSLWDGGDSWSGVEPVWVALDGWTVRGITTRRGRDKANRRHPSGTATVDLVYRTPEGAWSFRPTSPVALGQEIRVRVRVLSLADGSTVTTLPIYRGAVRRIVDYWTPAAPDRPGLFRLVAQLSDRLSDLAAVDLPESALTGLGDTTDERLVRILDLALIDTYYLRGPAGAALPAGVVEHASSNFARNLLDEAQVSVESETGELYVDREGFLVFRERLGTGAYAREDTAQLTWANDDTPDTLAPSTFGTSQDLDDVVNQISMARTGGTAYTVTDTDSGIAYGLRTHQRFDLTCRYDADVEYAADYWLAELAARTQRIDQVEGTALGVMPDDRLVELLDVEIGDRQAIRWTDYGATLEGEAHVQGVAHRISADNGAMTWIVAVNLWTIDDLAAAPALWGSAIWGTDVWGP